MIILISLLAITALGVFLFLKEYEFIGFILAIGGGILLFVALITLPIQRMEFFAKEKQLLAFKESLKTARGNDAGNIENAAILMKISAWNEFLAEMKYYNNTLFDIWIPDSIAEQEPIK